MSGNTNTTIQVQIPPPILDIPSLQKVIDTASKMFTSGELLQLKSSLEKYAEISNVQETKDGIKAIITSIIQVLTERGEFPMPQKLENKEEIILFALPLKESGESIPKIRAKVEIEFKTPVSQSFMQKNLAKYEGCKSKEDMNKRDEELQAAKDTTDNESEKIKWSETVQQLGNQVIADIFDNTGKYIEEANLIIPIPESGIIRINDITNIHAQIEGYLKEKLHPIVPVIEVETTFGETEQSEESTSEETDENDNSDNQQEPDQNQEELPEDSSEYNAELTEALEESL